MRQVHRAGEKIFVDFSGKKPQIVDRRTGELVEVELFVGALGASNYTYAEATASQKLHDWVGAHVRMLEYFGGSTAVWVPDQLRSAIVQPCRYEPGVNRTYQEMAEHYGAVVIPARPGKARDKAKVEAMVLVAQRWILARLRNRTFFSSPSSTPRSGSCSSSSTPGRCRSSGRAGGSCGSGSTGRRSSRCRRRGTSLASGRSAR